MKRWLAFCLLVVGCVSSSHAAVVQLSGSNATGILDLEIGGLFYDVAFDFTTVGSTPDLRDVFLGNETGAEAAARAIVAAFNSTAAVTVGTGFSGNGSQSFVVPYSYADPACAPGPEVGLCAWSGASGLAPNTWGAIAAEKDQGVEVEFARFTPANPVPLPPAAFLFASGLALLGCVRRRQGGAL